MKKCEHCGLPCGDVCLIEDPVICEVGHVVSEVSCYAHRAGGMLMCRTRIDEKHVCWAPIYDLPGPVEALHGVTVNCDNFTDEYRGPCGKALSWSRAIGHPIGSDPTGEKTFRYVTGE